MNGLLQDALIDYRRRILALEEITKFFRQQRFPWVEDDVKALKKRVAALEEASPPPVDESVKDFSRWMSGWLAGEGYTYYTPMRLLSEYQRSREGGDGQPTG